MADENKDIQEGSLAKQNASSSDSTDATEALPQQKQQQEQQQQKQDQPQNENSENSNGINSAEVSTTSTSAAPSTASTNNSVNMAAIIGSITVPETQPNDLIQPPVNGSMSEEDQIRMSSKLSAFPDIPAATTSQHATAVRCTAGEMEVAELRVKIICQEKNIMALKMELKAAELQVEAKNKVDAKKTRLVELLDNKLKTVEARNTKLLDMLEQMLKDKDSSTNRLKEATGHMQDLSQRLVKSEKMKSELVQANTELRSMLESIENKGTQIAKLAMEKVLKYKDANDQMQQELSELKDEAAAAGKPSDTTATAAAAARSTSSTEQTTAACDQLWGKIVELQQQIATVLQKVQDSATVEHLQQTIQEASEANTALGVSVEAARQKTGEGLSALGAENDQLRALVDDFDVARREMARKEAISQDLIKEQKEFVNAKDKEIEDLREELKSLKNAIGHLIGASK